MNTQNTQNAQRETYSFPTPDELAQPFPQDKIKDLPGKFYQPYAAWQDLVDLLNHRFGPDGWSSKITRNEIVFHEIRDLQKSRDNAPISRRMVAAEAACEITIKVEGREIKRGASAGFSAIEDYSKNGGIGAIDKSLKSAATNAFKKAVAMIGPAWAPSPHQKSANTENSGNLGNPSSDSPFSQYTQNPVPAPVQAETPAPAQVPIQAPTQIPIQIAPEPSDPFAMPASQSEQPSNPFQASAQAVAATDSIIQSAQHPQQIEAPQQVIAPQGNELPEHIAQRHEAIIDTARVAPGPSQVLNLLETEKERLRKIWNSFTPPQKTAVKTALDSLEKEMIQISEQVAQKQVL